MKPLGEGTSAIVRQAKRFRDGKEFAIKIVRTRDEEIITHVPIYLSNTAAYQRIQESLEP